MGLNIGIEVEVQLDGPCEEGSNPKGTQAEIEERFFTHLRKKLPDRRDFGPGWVKRDRSVWDKGEFWDFDVRMAHYGDRACDEVYLAIFEFVLNEFSPIAGIKSTTYWSG